MAKRDDDEQELIDAEFLSIVEDLEIITPAETSYLDTLDDIDAQAERTYRSPKNEKTSIRNTFKRWFKGGKDVDGDGAQI